MHVCDTLTPQENCRTVEAGGGSSLHIIRGIFPSSGGCWLGWICVVTACPYQPAPFLGAGSFVCQGNRGALSAGGGAAPCHGGVITPRSGFGRNGRRPSQWGACRCGGRDMGRTVLCGFYRDAAFGSACRSAWRGVLADPAGGCARFKCCTQSVVGVVAAIGAASGRSHRAGRSALAGRSVPVALCRPRCMGGAV
jgi:hypothetical protein